MFPVVKENNPVDTQVNNMPMAALVHPVYDCLMRLAQPDALMNEEEVRKSMWLFPV